MANEFKVKKGLIVTGADGGTVVDIQGSQGQLFSVTDDLSGSIFAVSDISGVPILDINSSGLSTFDGDVVIGSVDSVVTGLNIGEASPTIQLFDTTNDGKLLMYMQDSSAVVGTYSNHALKLFSDSTLALTIDTSQNATFAGDVISNGNIKINTGNQLFFDGGTNATYISEDVADRLRFFVGGAEFMRFTESTADTVNIYKDTTFGTQAFATTATSSGDASSTLTTKGYVDGLITGATIYRGAWDPSGGGYGSPDLSGVTQTSGYYYICSAAGTAEPNGTGTEPDTWETGDWVIYNDVSGTGQWQKIDNSSVLSGVGTGQTVALWEGAGSVTDSDTLGNAPITVSGSDTAFAGMITVNGGGIDIDNDDDIRLRFDNASAFKAGLQVATTAGDMIAGSAIDDFAIRAQENMLFSSGGNVEVLRLDTSGDATFAGDVTATTFLGDLNGTINTATTGVTQTAGDDSTKIATTAYADAAAAAVPIGDYLPLSAGDSYPLTGNLVIEGSAKVLRLKRDANQSWIQYIGSNDDFIIRDETDSRSAFVAKGSGDVYFPGGNVGIGAASPAAKLHVLGTSSDNATTKAEMLSNSVFSVRPHSTNSGTLAIAQVDNGNSVGMQFTNGSGTSNWDISMQPFGGNVGIGTTNPVARLQVSSSGLGQDINDTTTQAIFNSSNSNQSNLYIQDYRTAAGNDWTFSGKRIQEKIDSTWMGYMQFNGTGNNGGISFGTGQSTTQSSVSEKMRINSSGNVGIGTSPVAKLHVLGSVILDGHSTSDPDSTSRLAYPADQMFTHYNNNGVSIIGGKGSYTGVGLTIGEETTRSSNFKFIRGVSDTNGGVNAAEEFWVNGIGGAYFAGNVGIGETTPTSKLEIRSETATHQLVSLNRAASSTAAMYLGNDSGSNAIISSNNSDLIFGRDQSSTLSEWMRIKKDGNVGIGTTSPNAQLEISNSTTTSGSGGATLRLTRADGTSVAGDPVGTIEFYSTDADGPKTTAYIKSMSEELYGRKGSLAFGTSITNNTDAVEAMRIDSSGDVGIGVTNPDARIHALNSGLAAKFVSSQGTALEVQGGGNSQPIARFKNTAASEKVTISSTGNLGIGTTSPGSLLSLRKDDSTLYDPSSDDGQRAVGATILLNNNDTTTNTFGQIMYDTDSSGQGVARIVFLDAGTASSAIAFVTEQSDSIGERMRIDSIGNVGIGTDSPGAKLDIQGTQGQLFSVTDDLSGDIFSVADISGVPIMNVNSDGTSYFDGNVGIGTTSPGVKLDVNGSIRVSGRTTPTSGNGLEMFYYSPNDVFYIEAYDYTNTAWKSIRYSAASHQFTTGNVGIGTTSPGTKLHVSSSENANWTTTFQNTLNSNSHSVFTAYNNNSNNTRYGVYISGAGTTDSDYHLLVNSQFAVVGDGKVGIGTTSPETPLHILTNTTDNASTMLIQNGSTGDASIKFNISGDTYSIGIDNSDSDKFKLSYGAVGTNDRIVVDTSGNVGIGTSSPGYKLDVNGSLHSSNITVADGMYHESDANTYINFLPDTIQMATAGSVRAYITSTGNVGIGTTNPGSYKLKVAGVSDTQGLVVGYQNLLLYDNNTYSPEFNMTNNTHSLGVDYQNNETLRFITRSGVTTVPITFQMRAGTITAVNFILSSDERKKTKIENLKSSTVDVQWKSFEMKDNEGEYRTGVIAQELEKNHPEFVNTDEEGYKSVKYIDLLIAKIAELEARLEKLEK